MNAGEERENRKQQAESDLSTVAKKWGQDAKHQKKLANDYQTILTLDPIHLDPQSFPKKFTKANIVLQLNWHRTFSPARAQVPMKSKCRGNKLELLETLTMVIGLFLENRRTVADCIKAVEGLEEEEDEGEAETKEMDLDEDYEID
ncbi:hypothetical protein BT96DRAFT_640958 [Gymnopus androsaceus JB14]|uniref:Uncharacterized protein n=1 Tax=Gymnopus androsaceus JB14 TaxID=1447944 RepID=A0A6A4GGP1_9AGAR|nr:hypothetical protein BT96DRAFT_640958 [Gymnopus androsaceus JB14]